MVREITALYNMTNSVLIRSGELYYLYPKKRCNSQKLIELDRTGIMFYDLFLKYKNASKVINVLCQKYGVRSENEKNVIEEDVNKFVDTFACITDRKDTSFDSEICFSNGFKKMQNSFTYNNRPYKFFIELTYKCNLRCMHCYRQEDVYENNQIYLDKEKVFELLDEIEAMGAVEIIFTGGEPFLHPYIYEILEYASRKNLIITVLTNANTLSNFDNIMKLKKVCLFDIRVSIYGNKAYHDKMTRVDGSYEKSINALKGLNRELGIGTAVYVVTKENYACFRDVAEDFRNEEINLAVNTMITPTAKGNKEPCSMRIDRIQYSEIVTELNLPITGTICTAGRSRFRIGANGIVYPCELIPKHDFGNIYEKSLEDILNGKARIDFIAQMDEEMTNHICNSCDNKKFCNFCPALFFQENGTFSKPSEYLCEITDMKRSILIRRGQL